jgi:hypothetical protein
VLDLFRKRATKEHPSSWVITDQVFYYLLELTQRRYISWEIHDFLAETVIGDFSVVLNTEKPRLVLFAQKTLIGFYDKDDEAMDALIQAISSSTGLTHRTELFVATMADKLKNDRPIQ